LNKYETLREQNIARNNKHIEELGLPSLAGEFKEASVVKGSGDVGKALQAAREAASKKSAATSQRQTRKRQRSPSLYVIPLQFPPL
jgi:hypothetical protein